MRHVRVGQVRSWRLNSLNSPELWKKTNKGWKKTREGVVGKRKERGLKELREEQQRIWHTFMDSLFDGHKPVSKEILGEWLQHVSIFGHHTPISDVLHALRVASLVPDAVPGLEAIYSMYGHLDPWDGEDIKKLAAKIVKKREGK